MTDALSALLRRMTCAAAAHRMRPNHHGTTMEAKPGASAGARGALAVALVMVARVALAGLAWLALVLSAFGPVVLMIGALAAMVAWPMVGVLLAVAGLLIVAESWAAERDR